LKQTLALTITSNEGMPGVYLIWLEAPQIVSEVKAGQFAMVRCGEDALLSRPLSVHQIDGNKLALLVNVVGKGTEWLSQRKQGDIVELFGPLGNGFSIKSTSHNVLLVAGGIGIAPLRFLADEAVKQGRTVTLLMGAASTVHLLPEPIDSAGRGLPTGGVLPWGITILKSTDDGSEGYKGLVTQLLLEKQLIDGADQVFACGPLPMYQTMAQMPELKEKLVQISLEIMMGCGRGLCYGCTIKTRQGQKKVCQDGPVFDLQDVLWDDLVFTTG